MWAKHAAAAEKVEATNKALESLQKQVELQKHAYVRSSFFDAHCVACRSKNSKECALVQKRASHDLNFKRTQAKGDIRNRDNYHVWAKKMEARAAKNPGLVVLMETEAADVLLSKENMELLRSAVENRQAGFDVCKVVRDLGLTPLASPAVVRRGQHQFDFFGMDDAEFGWASFESGGSRAFFTYHRRQGVWCGAAGDRTILGYAEARNLPSVAQLYTWECSVTLTEVVS
jgi:hypothetical protein